MKKNQRNILIIGILLSALFAGIFVSVYPLTLVENGDDPPDPPIPPIPPDPNPPDVPILSTIESPSITGVIEITWSSIENADYYEVYRSKGGGSSIPLGRIYTNSYTDTIVIDGTYTYKIRAFNEFGESGYSNEEFVVVNLEENGDEDDDDDENRDGEPQEDYTLVYILLGVLAVLIVPAIILTRKKKNKRRKS